MSIESLQRKVAPGNITAAAQTDRQLMSMPVVDAESDSLALLSSIDPSGNTQQNMERLQKGIEKLLKYYPPGRK